MIRSLTFTSFFIFSATAFSQGNIYQVESKLVSINEKSPATTTDIIFSLEKPINVQTVDVTSIFVGSAELGFLYKTGNTNSGDIKTGVDLRFENGAWLSLLNIDLLIKKADIIDVNDNNDNGNKHFETTDQKWTLTSQTNYSLDNKEKNYIYGNFWFEENKFSGFVNQSSISTGWGRHWYKSKNTSLWGDIGPGYKRDLFKATEAESQRTADALIIQAQALYIKKLSEHIELQQHVSAKQALDTNENSIYKAETTITTKLISTLQLKFTFTLDYNSKVEDNSEVEGNKKNLDTQTAVTLVYSF